MSPFTPARPALSSARHMGAPMRRSQAQTATVRPGETLWNLAAAQLGSSATDWEIARQWPRWHRHNADRIGEDPRDLRPGMILRIPPHDPSAL